MEYRFNFFLAFLTSLGNLVASVFALFLFYRTGYTFDGWRWDEALVVLGFFTMLQGLSRVFLDPNIRRMVYHVQYGTLDFVLLKAVNARFWLSVRDFSPWGIPDLALGVSVVAYAGHRLQLQWVGYILACIAFLLGAASLYSLWFILGASSIWLVKIYVVTDLLRGILSAGRFPVGAYPAAYRLFFTFVLPVTFLTTVPAEALLGRTTASWMLGAVVLAAGLFTVSHVFWRLAVRSYTGASS
jgi:ABC-2 type transport system permease protein